MCNRTFGLPHYSLAFELHDLTSIVLTNVLLNNVRTLRHITIEIIWFTHKTIQNNTKQYKETLETLYEYL